jgi:hypothetical protein
MAKGRGERHQSGDDKRSERCNGGDKRRCSLAVKKQVRQSIHSGHNGFLASIKGRHMGDGHPTEAMGFIHGSKKSLVACYPKSGKTDHASIFNKDFYIVSSIGNLLIDEFDCIDRG